MRIPDVIAYLLKDAVEIIESEYDLEYTIKSIAPPGRDIDISSTDLRVVRVDETGDNKVQIIVCDPHPKVL